MPALTWNKKSQNQFLREKNVPNNLKKIQIDCEETKKVIQINEEHLKKFDITLWHISISIKYVITVDVTK